MKFAAVNPSVVHRVRAALTFWFTSCGMSHIGSGGGAGVPWVTVMLASGSAHPVRF